MLVGDRALQVLRRAEAERARVADVELDQLAALGLQLAGAPGQFAADLVTDFGQAFAGLHGGRDIGEQDRGRWPARLAEKASDCSAGRSTAIGRRSVRTRVAQSARIRGMTHPATA